MTEERITAADIQQVSAEELAGKPRIVAGIGTASGAKRDGPGLAQALEHAQSVAVMRALEEGVSIDNSEELLKRKAAARDLVKKQFRGEV